jgi:hypothetical protein
MSYCRFHNTKIDLADCLNNFWDVQSSSEAKHRKRLVQIAKDIIAEYESDPTTVDSEHYEKDDDDDSREGEND